MSEQRKAFEAWASTRYSFTQISTDGGRTWQYPSSDPQKLAWEAWQAAIEHAKKTMCNAN